MRIAVQLFVVPTSSAAPAVVLQGHTLATFSEDWRMERKRIFEALNANSYSSAEGTTPAELTTADNKLLPTLCNILTGAGKNNLKLCSEEGAKSSMTVSQRDALACGKARSQTLATTRFGAKKWHLIPTKAQVV